LGEGAPAIRADLVYFLKKGEKKDYQEMIEVSPGGYDDHVSNVL